MPGHVVLMVDAACEHRRAESKVGDKGEHNFYPAEPGLITGLYNGS